MQGFSKIYSIQSQSCFKTGTVFFRSFFFCGSKLECRERPRSTEASQPTRRHSPPASPARNPSQPRRPPPLPSPPVRAPPAGARLLYPYPRPPEATPDTDAHGAEGGGRASPAVPGARAADSPQGPEHQRRRGAGGRGGGGGEGEEEQEEEPVRRGAVPAGLGRRLQGRQDHLARRLLPDHQDQPLQGWPPREGVGDSAQGRCASGRRPDKTQRSEQAWLEVHKGIAEGGAGYPRSRDASRCHCHCHCLIHYRLEHLEGGKTCSCRSVALNCSDDRLICHL